MDAYEPMENGCCILSQDLFCTPDYITPEMPQVAKNSDDDKVSDDDKENIPCPKSPEKSANPRSKRYRADYSPKGLQSREFSFDLQITPMQFDSLTRDESEEEKLMQPVMQMRGGYVSQSAVALRYRVMPPPGAKNPYLS